LSVAETLTIVLVAGWTICGWVGAAVTVIPPALAAIAGIEWQRRVPAMAIPAAMRARSNAVMVPATAHRMPSLRPFLLLMDRPRTAYAHAYASMHSPLAFVDRGSYFALPVCDRNCCGPTDPGPILSLRRGRRESSVRTLPADARSVGAEPHARATAADVRTGGEAACTGNAEVRFPTETESAVFEADSSTR
jgi:hypothetical protein